jgi:hypothetical protein
VDAINSTQGHPTPETLEEYSFQRLSEADTEGVEEHLLVCGECQCALAEIDEYIVLMKAATARPKKPVVWYGAARTRAAALPGWSYATGGIALATAVVLAIALWPASSTGPAQSVELLALRGGEQTINHVRAGHPLDLKMDLSGLPEHATRYRVEVVTVAGVPDWSGEIGDPESKAAVHLAQGLRSGMYWVRLFSHDELLREFELRVD